MKTMKTWILTYTLADGNSVNLVVSESKRTAAFKKAEPLLWQLTAQSGFRCVKRSHKCLG